MSNEICQTVLVCQNNRYSNVDKFYQKNILLLYILRIYSNTYINMCLKYRNTCSVTLHHRIEINRKATRVGTFEVCVSTHVSLRIFIMQVLASQLPFLANRNAELAVPPLFWPDNCIKIGGRGPLGIATCRTCCNAERSYCLYPILCLHVLSIPGQ